MRFEKYLDKKLTLALLEVVITPFIWSCLSIRQALERGARQVSWLRGGPDEVKGFLCREMKATEQFTGAQLNSADYKDSRRAGIARRKSACLQLTVYQGDLPEAG